MLHIINFLFLFGGGGVNGCFWYVLMRFKLTERALCSYKDLPGPFWPSAARRAKMDLVSLYRSIEPYQLVRIPY